MIDMNNIDGSLNDIMTLNGAIAASLIDWESGMALGMVNNGNFDIELASAGNAEVVKSKMAVMRSLNIKGDIKDILITLQDQIHIITLTKEHPELFLYAVLDSSKANLALARNKLSSIAKA